MRQDIKAINYYHGIPENEHAFVRKYKGADYRHVCFFCDYPRRHQVHGLEEGLEREPRHPVLSYIPSAESVRSCYATLIDVLDEYNEHVGGDYQVMVPFVLQEVLAAYIEERETIENLTKKRP